MCLLDRDCSVSFWFLSLYGSYYVICDCILCGAYMSSVVTLSLGLYQALMHVFYCNRSYWLCQAHMSFVLSLAVKELAVHLLAIKRQLVAVYWLLFSDVIANTVGHQFYFYCTCKCEMCGCVFAPCNY